MKRRKSGRGRISDEAAVNAILETSMTCCTSEVIVGNVLVAAAETNGGTIQLPDDDSLQFVLEEFAAAYALELVRRLRIPEDVYRRRLDELLEQRALEFFPTLGGVQ